jgi:hypothetical protein
MEKLIAGLTPDQIDALKADHGQLHVLEACDRAIIVKMPSRQEYRKFKTMGMDAQKRPDALEVLVKLVTVHPVRHELEAMFEQLPALAETFGGKVVELAGAVEDASVKKL